MRYSLVLASVVAALVLAAAAPAAAAWSDDGAGAAAGRALVMPDGLRPVASASGSDVALRWPAALLPNGTAVGGYLISRFGANGQPVAVLADCAGTITSTTCTEHNVPAGTWSYTDTPVLDNWTGRSSPQSAPVTVLGP
jgi:hypothetical protein